MEEKLLWLSFNASAYQLWIIRKRGRLILAQSEVGGPSPPASPHLNPCIQTVLYWTISRVLNRDLWWKRRRRRRRVWKLPPCAHNGFGTAYEKERNCPQKTTNKINRILQDLLCLAPAYFYLFITIIVSLTSRIFGQ